MGGLVFAAGIFSELAGAGLTTASVVKALETFALLWFLQYLGNGQPLLMNLGSEEEVCPVHCTPEFPPPSFQPTPSEHDPAQLVQLLFVEAPL
eukprot:CAMPEP_0117893706 /NCGR_PEP_ID=MMETSP0950-20121206/25490_1 /TAXON_ID=44440 /ORGANISM="Chattonella subsalsa, Strain CCMP2191" /LENGTH=92 /DNA_ID=CAMNT_0005754025 /DNA_START=763 /DNA_END=1042 /DNA_ORIENTATION=+